jgi:uncharacterized lipoprotein NlpE involved in copper resistance
MKHLGFYFTTLLLLTSLIMASCGSDPAPSGDDTAADGATESSTAKEAPTPEPAATGAQTDTTTPVIAPEVAAAISWMGVYTGLYPCSKCQGVDVRLKLNRDYTFVITKFHRGPHDPAEFRDKGMYTWDSTGTRLTTESIVGEKPMQFIYSEKKLTQLDDNGQKYTGKLAGRYILTK